MAEVTVAMLVMSIIVVVTLPLLTGRKLSLGTDKLAQACINTDSGNILKPNCISAISNCKVYNGNNSCNNLVNYASNGTTVQKSSALKILQEACNQGGALACNYFINLCVNNNAMCNITSTTPATGLRSFLLKDNFDNTFGKLFLEVALKDYYTDNVMNIFNEVNTDCCVSGVPNAACNIKNVFTCVITPKPCTLGTSAGVDMGDGTKKIADFNGHALCTTSTDMVGPQTGGTYYWNNGSTNWAYTYTTNANDGQPNTSTLASLVDGESPYAAAKACEDLVANGHNDWYLPALNELSLMYTNRVAIGNFNTSSTCYSLPNSYNSCPGVYWASTEASGDNMGAFLWLFYSGGQSANIKAQSYSVRCIRKD